MELNDLLARDCVLPSAPRVVALLGAELMHAEPSLRRVNQFLSTDPALTARLLELVNAPGSGLERQVNGIAECLMLIDTAQLRMLVTSAVVGTTSRSVPGVNLQSYWRYSLSTARLARSLAGLVRNDQVAAYTAGLLHGLGEVVMHLLDPQTAQEIDQIADPLDLRRARAEHRKLGYCYAQVSAGLASRWHLPQRVVDAVRYHDKPFANEVYEPLAGVLHLAAWRMRAHEAGLDERALAATFPGEIGVTLGMDIDTVLQQDPIDWSAQFNEAV